MLLRTNPKMKIVTILLEKYKSDKKIRQAFSLMSWNFLGIPLGMFTSIIITRFMGSKTYGDYMYINNILNFAIILLNFGFFQAGNRAIVLSNNKEKTREYFGAQLIVLFGIYIVITIALYTFSIFDHNIAQKGIQHSLLYIIPFSFIFLLMQYFDQLLQADNQINLLIISRYYPRFGFFISGLIIYFLFRNFVGNRLVVIWIFFLFTQFVIYVFVLFKLKISLFNFKIRITELFQFNKKFGIKVYTGNLFSTAIAQFTPILVSYFGNDNSGVGFYSLAFTLVAPLSFIPNVIATTHYKEFSTLEKIPANILKLTIGITILALIILLVIIPPFVHFFYKKEFLPVIDLCYITSAGVLLYGISDFFSKFLGAHGDGIALRNSSFIVGFFSLLFSVVLIPKFHEKGAAIAYFAASLTYVISIVYFYKKYKTKQIIK